ncbi:hypothetical protein GEMRC1_014079 [Eukaryota sp. GEM-RC1]
MRVPILPPPQLETKEMAESDRSEELEQLRRELAEILEEKYGLLKKLEDLQQHIEHSEKKEKELEGLLFSKKQDIQEREDLVTKLGIDVDELTQQKAALEDNLAAKSSEMSELQRELEEKTERLKICTENRNRRSGVTWYTWFSFIVLLIAIFVFYQSRK